MFAAYCGGNCALCASYELPCGNVISDERGKPRVITLLSFRAKALAEVEKSHYCLFFRFLHSLSLGRNDSILKVHHGFI